MTGMAGCARAANGQPATRVPKSARKSRRLTCRSTTGSGTDSGPLEVAVEMPLALQVALFEHPAVAALWIGQDLPAIIVAIPEEEAVGAVLEMRFGDFLQPPLLGLGADG